MVRKLKLISPKANIMETILPGLAGSIHAPVQGIRPPHQNDLALLGTSLLHRLPAELRIMIWKEVMRDECRRSCGPFRIHCPPPKGVLYSEVVVAISRMRLISRAFTTEVDTIPVWLYATYFIGFSLPQDRDSLLSFIRFTPIRLLENVRNLCVRTLWIAAGDQGQTWHIVLSRDGHPYEPDVRKVSKACCELLAACMPQLRHVSLAIMVKGRLFWTWPQTKQRDDLRLLFDAFKHVGMLELLPIKGSHRKAREELTELCRDYLSSSGSIQVH